MSSIIRILFLFPLFWILTAASPSLDPFPPALRDLLEIFHLPPDAPLKAIVEKTQKCWFQSCERWEMSEHPLDPSAKERILQDVKDLGFVEEIPPRQQAYSTAVLFGATTPSVKKRWDYLCDLWRRGIRFDQIVVLGAERPLHPEVDQDPAWESLSCPPKNETEMMRWVIAQYPCPEDMQRVSILWIHTKGSWKEGVWIRPYTEDTIRAWVQQDEPRGNLLFISNQPFVLIQDAVARMVLGSRCPLETAGPAAHPQTKISLYLDSVARWLYYENLINENEEKQFP